MALFGGQRDVSLFRSLNRELLHRIIDTEVLIYTLNLNATQTNIYEESGGKVYNPPTLLYCLVALENEQWNADDYGSDVTQRVTFAFLRDDLVDNNLPIQVGDVIEYTSKFFEIDSTYDNQYVVGKDPDNAFAGTTHGYNISIVCEAHLTRLSKLNIAKSRFGNSISIKDNTLPNNL